jgi:predicted transcriptional regulator
VYSPKIPERLIPRLYRLARARRQPMTTLVAEVLEDYLAHQPACAAGAAEAATTGGPVPAASATASGGTAARP